MLSRSHDENASAIERVNGEDQDRRSEAMPILRQTEESAMKEYDSVLCLFCLSGRETEAAASINQRGCGKALFPQKTKYYRGKNEWLSEKAAIIPGYVFVYLQEAEAEHIYSFKELPQVIKILTYGDKDAWQLRASDLAFADWVWEQNGTINTIDAVQLGDRIEIVATELKHLRGRVARMDRRKRTVMIEMEGAGLINHVWLPYQVIQKIDEQQPVGEKKDGRKWGG